MTDPSTEKIKLTKINKIMLLSDVFITLSDIVSDLLVAISLWQTCHTHYAIISFVIIFLPSIIISVGPFICNSKGHPSINDLLE